MKTCKKEFQIKNGEVFSVNHLKISNNIDLLINSNLTEVIIYAWQEEDEAIKVKYLQDQTYTIQKPENGDCDVKGSKTKISTSKFHPKLSPKIGHRKKKRKIAKFKVNCIYGVFQFSHNKKK